MPKLTIIETLCKDNLPYGRLPTIDEVVAWVEAPDNHPELNDYMFARPDLTKNLRTILNFFDYHKQSYFHFY